MGAHNNLPPVHSCAQSPCRERIMCPLSPALCLWCVYCVSIPSRGMGATRMVDSNAGRSTRDADHSSEIIVETTGQSAPHFP